MLEKIIVMLTDLDEILDSLQPRLDPAEYLYCTVSTRPEIPWAEQGVIAVIREDEGSTLVIERDAARRLGLDGIGGFRRISLGVHSSLHAVGLTALAASTLSERGISANVIAGYYHDHFLVPAASVHEAMEGLQSLAAKDARS